ncbi:cytochrome bc complex cytochrome b subunit [Streptomyces sp. NPDC059651]|uniref:cytochrome bc1 complex cytochrome b subunit n=1 Tax=Streptomyces sp. NPDC059651 TaxID=3346897 RepID=UPI0036D10345
MGTEARPSESHRTDRGEKVADWADLRLSTRGAARAAARRAFPDHWSFLLGQIWLYCFVILLVTGAYLTLYFHPSSQQVRYQGSYAPLRGLWVSEAFDSTMHLSFDVRGGLLIRQAHHWAALIFVAALLVHMMRVFFTGAFRKPRELNWAVVFLLMILGMFGGLTGYDLPNDLLSGTGLAVVNGTLLSVPLIGTYLSMFLFGGEFPGDDLVARFNAIHVLVIPGLTVVLIVALMVLSLRHKPMQYAGPGRTNGKVVGLPFQVYVVKSAGFFLMVAGVVFLMAAIAQINPVWDYGPYRADQVSAGSQPDWYMGVADGLLRVMPGWEIDFRGHTLALDNFIPLLVGGGLFLALGAYPFIEAWVTGEDSEPHLLDRPRNRPVRTALGAAWLSFYAVAFGAAANDLIATQLHVSVNGVTWAARIGLVLVPLTVFVVVKRLALALQLGDRDKVLHGRETGRIRLMPHGEYVEVHESLSQERLHVLTAHQQHKPLTIAPGTAPAAHGSGIERLRTRLSRALYGPGTQIPKPTVEEHRAVAQRHRG